MNHPSSRFARARVRPHPRDVFTAWVCPHCGARQTLDPRDDVRRVVHPLPASQAERGPARRVRPPRVPTLELETKRCRSVACASVTVTANLGEITREDAARLPSHPPEDGVRRQALRRVDFHLTPDASRAHLPTAVPADVRRDVDEAQAIAAPSPRAAAALYRRALGAMVADHADEPATIGADVATALAEAPADPLAEVAVEDVVALARLVDRVAFTCYDDA